MGFLLTIHYLRYWYMIQSLIHSKVLWRFSSNSRILHSRTRDTHNIYRALSSGAFITCYYDLGLSRLGFVHSIFSMPGERSNRLCHENIRKYNLISHPLHKIGNKLNALEGVIIYFQISDVRWFNKQLHNNN